MQIVVLKSRKLPNGQTAELHQDFDAEETSRYKVAVYTADGLDWDWEEYSSSALSTATKRYEEVTCIEDLVY